MKVPKFLFPYLYGSAYHRAWFTLYGVVIKEIQVSFTQFFTWRFPFYSFFHTISVVLSSFNRLLLGRSLKYSFAFTGEDRIIESLLKKRISEKGYYVEVGSNHPTFISNTYGLYRRGWKGLCIDVNERLILKHRKCRPKDLAICALVSDQAVEKTFYHVENDVLSTLSVENLAAIKKEGLYFKETKVNAETLNELMKRHKVPFSFDLLAVDAEEHDYEVLKSIDFQIFRPKLIVAEDETYQIEDPFQNNIYKLLVEQGYRLEGYVLKNLYFIDSSRA